MRKKKMVAAYVDLEIANALKHWALQEKRSKTFLVAAAIESGLKALNPKIFKAGK